MDQIKWTAEYTASLVLKYFDSMPEYAKNRVIEACARALRKAIHESAAKEQA